MGSAVQPVMEPNREGRDHATLILLVIATAKLLIQMAAAGRYGYFRDELYFVDLSRHLDWGYLDAPPLIAGIAAAARTTLGTSLLGLRFLPALAGAVKVILAGLIARELGGKRFAQALAAVAVLAAPAFLGADHLLTMNAFEPVFWTGCAYFLIRAVKTASRSAWIGFGILAGLGLENKYSMFFFLSGILLGLLLSSGRRLLWNRWLWVAGLITLLIFLPNLIWQIHHGFISLAWLRYHRVDGHSVPLTPLDFIAEEIVELHPLACPIWMAGLWFYLGAREGEPYRTLGWAYLVVLSILLLLHGRVYYLFPAYPMLFGSGAVVMERAFRRPRWMWARPVYVSLLLVGATFLAPFALPVLPVKTYKRYSDALNIDPPDIEQRKLGPLPQLYADTFGWQEMTAAAARAYHNLPPGQRAATAIFANDYGEAGAIDLFGPRFGLPHALSPHQNYFYWGPGDNAGQSLLLLGHNPRLESECTEEKQAGLVYNEYSMPYENFPIILCKDLKQPLKEIWPDLRNWE
ncbi:MAG TPA: glycosyltransferase family 39 protein [Terriglobia bacterium]|nr:glycosyltransferase family 39 protein [Terriglobia bacterium]